jgi:hypothetical protein
MELDVKRRNTRHRHVSKGYLPGDDDMLTCSESQLTDVCLKIAEGNTTKAGGTKDEVWYFRWLVASQLDLAGMISDESNNKEPSSWKKCIIKSIPWHNEQLIPYLQRIDGDFNKANCYGNRRPSNAFRD